MKTTQRWISHLSHFSRKAAPVLVGAALVRVLVPALAPQLTLIAIDVSAACWILAFAGYLARYAGWLAKPRADGKPG